MSKTHSSTELRRPEAEVDALAAGRPTVVIVGGGFGGLACAREIGGADIDVVVIDRQNHNLFQPLLYQVATAALSPADIAEPIRKTLGRHRNVEVYLDEVVGVDAKAYAVLLADGRRQHFDYLVIATGSRYNYFGHDEWSALAPGLKTIADARTIRQRLLLALERAEMNRDPQERQALLTSIVVGGGPTGVEMAGAIAELGRYAVARDFRNLKPSEVRVLLVEGGQRILSGFPEELSQYAVRQLDRLGVEVVLGRQVEDINEQGAVIGGELVRAGTVVWGAGTKASPAAKWLGIETGRDGRIPVAPDLSVPAFPGIYVIGDTACALGQDGKPLPGLAQVAKQQGEYLGSALRRLIERGESPPPFRFKNRGNTAVIGRNAAVFDFGKWRLKGRLGWFLWALVHVYLLISFEKRVLVSVQWLWRYFTRQRGARLIS